MLLAVAGSWIYLRELRLNDIDPDPTNVWNVLELRIMVLFSLSVQMVLIFFGNRRKYKANEWLHILVWVTYQAADWVATFALGILSKESKNPTLDPNFTIMAIWAPFLLVHLGGPDTITAYALEDNELWLRRIIASLGQLVVAFLVVYSSWNGILLLCVTLPVLLAGLIKCAERALSLWLGSSKTFRESILPPPDPGPNYAKFMDDYTAKKAEGYEVLLDVETTPTLLGHSHGSIVNEVIPDASSLHHGFYFFKNFECLFADLILSFQDHSISRDFFRGITWREAFPIIEVELGLMYDMLYTKAKLMQTYFPTAICLKFGSFSLTVCALISFYFLMDKGQIDCERVITLVLFMGAIFLELYAFIVLLSSSWAMLWLSKHKNWGVDFLYMIISFLQKCFKLSHTRRWSNRMSQFNLLSFCLKDEPSKFIKILKFFGIHKCCCGEPLYNWLKKSVSFYKKDPETVSEALKELIFEQLKEKSEKALNIEACKRLCAFRVDRVLDKCNCRADVIDLIDKGEFDQNILLWHIATDLCYYSDVTNDSNIENDLPSCKISKLLSNYMLYLLVICPFMLPNGIGQIRFRDTCAEADELLQERKYISRRDQACKMILRVNTHIRPSEVKGDRSKSVLFDACRLAKSLQSLETKENWLKKQKWEMISNIWVEMLCHAASQCRGLDHAKQLSQGGELLTHVWLLMAHLGITEQFQISQGHARPKFTLS